MPTTVEQIIDDIMAREGDRYTDHPADHGGPTKYGITQDTLGRWRGREASADDVRHLTKDEARDIYRKMYYHAPGFDMLAMAPAVALLVDCAVNHGPRQAVRFLQTALNIIADGIIGPATRTAYAAADRDAVYRAILAERTRFYGRLITDTPSQAAFAAGWMARLSEFIEEMPE